MDNSQEILLKEIHDLRDENKRLKERINELNPIDQLTGLLNRKAMFEKLEYEVLRAERNQTFLSLLLLKLSGFEDIDRKSTRLNSSH